MNRQLRRGGGIMNVTPREQFGIGSSLKKFVRKIIPNEISKVATVAAPFVAPFNPQIAAAMAGIGSFDQTGSISDALKRGALTYGGGQAARFIGGAGPQDFSLSAFTPSGFKAGFSSPIGIETGLKLGQYKMFGGPGKTISEVPSTGGVELVGSDVGGNITLAESAGGAGNIVDEVALTRGSAVDAATPGITTTKNSLLSNVRNKDFKGVTENISDLIKKGGRAVFYTPRTDQSGNVVGYDLDKNVLLAAGAFGLTYLDAKKIANEAGQDISEEEFSSVVDDAKLAEKKEFYANNLANFFGGKKDGGRIGFDNGGDVSDRAQKYLEYLKEMELMGVEPVSVEEFNKMLDAMKENMADGGRIGLDLVKKLKIKKVFYL